MDGGGGEPPENRAGRPAPRADTAVPGLPSRLRSVLAVQSRTLRLFLSTPSTRTPCVVIYVACLGGSLHHAVTSYFYLAVGATSVDIGRIGFVQSVGGLVGGPLVGAALDRWGPWRPIAVTAAACASGCLFRGISASVPALLAAAVLLGAGNNLWTAVLGHLVKSFPPGMRSEVLSGFGVQTSVIQLAGRAAFPIVEYGLLNWVGVSDDLRRYRVHMAGCTAFCIYGTIALFFDRGSVRGSGVDSVGETGEGATLSSEKHAHEHSDAVEGSEAGIELASLRQVEAEPFPNETMSRAGAPTDIAPSRPSAKGKRGGWMATATLTSALLLQSVSTTTLSVLWPLVAYDHFGMSAQTFGILTFVSSLTSAGAVASFPTVERWEGIGGRVRCAAMALGSAAVCCGLFVLCTFGAGTGGGLVDSIAEGEMVAAEDGTNLPPSEALLAERFVSRSDLLLHASSAVALQAALTFLEPQLKSILSLSVDGGEGGGGASSSLGLAMGGLATLGNVGGSVGNLVGTALYKASMDDGGREGGGVGRIPLALRGGALPFVALSVLLALCSCLVSRLDEPAGPAPSSPPRNETDDVEKGGDGQTEAVGDGNGRDGYCLALRETTYDLKLE